MPAFKIKRSPGRTWQSHGFTFLLGIALSALAIFAWQKNRLNDSAEPQPRYNILQLQGFKKIKPILTVERPGESKKLNPLKLDLQGLLDSLYRAGALTEASVYLRDLDNGRWIAINPDAQFHPASLMKVPLLLAYLRMAEAVPGLLKQEVEYEPPAENVITPQYYAAPTITPGKKYTIHELLYYMIAYSDNHATWVLASRFDPAGLHKIFTDCGLPAPIADDLKFTMSAKDYSLFFKIIYNSAYLSPEYSEYAANLLSNCTFADGFVKGLPPQTDIWHKFGEWRGAGHDHELHESGVITLYGRPYALTVMTRGKDTDRLAQVIGLIAARVNSGARLLAP